MTKTISAFSRIEAADPKAEPNFQALSVLKLADLICHLWQQYVNTALLPLARSSVTVRREMVIFNNQTVSRIEGAANALLNRLTDCEYSNLLVLKKRMIEENHSHPFMAFGAARETKEARLQAQE